ncbi:MOSC beta barrel domain-containing protein [Cladophialophora immunda]|nr:MOSC beta barrel domain-containing protein [Cladophialophora immunda]
MLAQLLQELDIRSVLHSALRIILLINCAIFIIRGIRHIYITRRSPKHLRRVGINGLSNLADQYDIKYDHDEEAAAKSPIVVKALYIHPIKSCAPIELERAQLTKTGFAYDRCFALAVEVKKDEWQFISQRTKPQMARIQQELWLPGPNGKRGDILVEAGGCLTVSFPDPDPAHPLQRLKAMFETWSLSARPEVRFTVPLLPTPDHINQMKIQMRHFTIHSRQATGLDLGKLPDVAAAIPKLKRFLGLPARQNLTLTRCTPDTLVRTTRNLAPLEHIGTPAMHGYTDQQPVHIINLSSVHTVSKLLPPENQPLSALRFRANIYLTGAPAFSEETWKRYRILPKTASSGMPTKVPSALSVVCRTSRCTMPNVNPDTGTFEHDNSRPDRKKGVPQPSTTLIEHRTVEDGNPAALGYLGMHCVPEDSSLREARHHNGELYVEVGDEIEVLETGSHLYGSTGNDY